MDVLCEEVNMHSNRQRGSNLHGASLHRTHTESCVDWHIVQEMIFFACEGITQVPRHNNARSLGTLKPVTWGDVAGISPPHRGPQW